MQNKRFSPLIFTTICCLGISSAFSEPYTAWKNDYTGTEPHTIALWQFDDFHGVNKNSYDGSATPNPYPSANIHVGHVNTGVEGKFGTGIEIVDASTSDNSARAFSIGKAEELFHGSAISVELWYQAPEAPMPKGYFFDKMYTSKSGLRLSFRNEELVLEAGNGEQTMQLTVPSPVLEANTWYHLAVTYENTNGLGILKLYLNGELLGDTEAPDFGDLDAGDRVWTLGNRSASSYSPLLGTYDNFRISDTVYEYAP